MRELLYLIVEIIAVIHNKIMSLNDAWEYSFTDKELHFLIIGIIGMLMVFMVYPVFKWLANHNAIMTMTWIYVFTLVIVLTFAIEIGQKVSQTGVMEFADIMFGLVGFIVMFSVFAVFRQLFYWMCRFLSQK